MLKLFCEKCGNVIKDGTKFCEHCGESVALPETSIAPEQNPVVEQKKNDEKTVYINNYHTNKRQPASVAGWIFRPLIACIPLVGPIIYFIMLFVWARDKSKEESFNNWAKAQLILLLIAVLIVILVILVIVIMGALAGSTIGVSTY